MGGFGDFVSDIVSSGANMITTPTKMVWDAVSGVMKPGDQKADIGRESDYQKKMAALGTDELGRYKDIASGKDPGVTEEQQLAIDKKLKVEQAQLRQGLSEMGIADSTARLSGESAALQDKISLEEQTRRDTMKEHWDAFVKATGIAEGSSQIIAQMHDQDRKEAIEIYAATMSVMGGAAGKSSGSKSVVSEYAEPERVYSDPISHDYENA